MVLPHGWASEEDDRYRWDFGIIVRGPHPQHQDKMIAVVAGRSALGTEAACTALTDIKTITKIRRHLGASGVDLEDHRHPFWVIVSMRRAIGDEREEAIRESLTFHSLATFERRRDGVCDRTR